VTIYGNVVKATHGETRKEILGSGAGSQVFQAFTLKQPPLTFVAAANPTGIDSTLKVYVNEVRWHEVDSLAELAATDREFITHTDDDGKTSVIFGNGQRGARLPTGRENVRAEYRQGIGQAGNVKAGQLSQLLTRPLGVKDVINPLRASGGADKENRDQARQNAPLALLALDRLVSVSDYADFTRTFAGIGKAVATKLTQSVHVTIAGAEDIPIEPSSDLYRNLLLALRQNGDPYQPFQVDLRELLLLVISANVKLQADYVWETVVTQVRTKLLETFSFGRRELGQDVFLSEVISTMQAVPGVEYVDVDLLAAIPEKIADNGTRRLLTPAEITDYVARLVAAPEGQPRKLRAQKQQPVSRIAVGLAEREAGTVRPAQLAILSANVPDTLILNRI
jgi:predicted phage baseplate assembly protein